MELGILELDAKGIIPKDFEKEESFFRRGNLILQASKEISDSQLMGWFKKYKANYKFLPFQYGVKEREEGLQYIKIKYGSDLSWVRFLNMYPASHEFYRTSFSGGVAAGFKLEIEGMEIILPVIAMFVRKKDYYIHELIHVARQSFVTQILEHAGRDEFEEVVAQNKYLRGSFLSTDYYSRMLYKIRRKLQKSFGNKHGYVFTRLEHAELVENILPKKPPFGEPISYIRKFSDTHLKYRVLRERLEL